MTTLQTTDGYVFVRQPDGTYTDGDDVYTATEILNNGRDN